MHSSEEVHFSPTFFPSQCASVAAKKIRKTRIMAVDTLEEKNAMAGRRTEGDG